MIKVCLFLQEIAKLLSKDLVFIWHSQKRIKRELILASGHQRHMTRRALIPASSSAEPALIQLFFHERCWASSRVLICDLCVCLSEGSAHIIHPLFIGFFFFLMQFRGYYHIYFGHKPFKRYAYCIHFPSLAYSLSSHSFNTFFCRVDILRFNEIQHFFSFLDHALCVLYLKICILPDLKSSKFSFSAF